MKLSKKITLLIQLTLIICLLTSTTKINVLISQSVNYNYRKMPNIAVLLNYLDNPYIKQFKQDLENVQNENKDKVKFTFFDGKNNASIQYESLDLATKGNFDLIVALLVDTTENSVKDFILKAKDHNIPLILINIDQEVVEKVSKYYDRVAFLLADPEAAGTAQGQMIANLWHTDKNNIDKNGDNILQYILITSVTMHEIANGRSEFAISAINDSGINTEGLQTIYGDWSRDIAKNAIENLFLRYAGKIEAIISNNDDMAIGAIEGIQKYGYNTGDKSKYIPVFGIGGVTEAKELVDKGFMAGTVIEDSKEFAEGTYIIGMNLINNVNPLENTDFKLENNEIRLLKNPKEYTHYD
jgi:methyl-galactoside transport system substrate-binding protein